MSIRRAPAPLSTDAIMTVAVRDGFILRSAGQFFAGSGRKLPDKTIRQLLDRGLLVEGEGDTLFPGVPSQTLRPGPKFGSANTRPGSRSARKSSANLLNK